MRYEPSASVLSISHVSYAYYNEYTVCCIYDDLIMKFYEIQCSLSMIFVYISLHNGYNNVPSVAAREQSTVCLAVKVGDEIKFTH